METCIKPDFGERAVQVDKRAKVREDRLQHGNPVLGKKLAEHGPSGRCEKIATRAEESHESAFP